MKTEEWLGVRENEYLRVYHWMPQVTDTLGPGCRAVVWVQGCSQHCPGCIAPEMWSADEGTLIAVEELAGSLLGSEQVKGLTISGGEPFDQAEALASLLAICKARGKNTWVYTGYTIEDLIDRDDPITDKVLSRTDVLVDGPFVRELAGTFRFRGSANQRIIHLTDAISHWDDNEDRTGRLQLTLTDEGRLVVVGVPPPNFLPKLKLLLEECGLKVNNEISW